MSKFNKIWDQEDIDSKGSLPKSQVSLLMKKLFDEHKDGDDILEILFDKLDEDQLAGTYARAQCLEFIDIALKKTNNE